MKRNVTRLRFAPRMGLLGLVLLAVLGASCAYYNTFYLARRYYMKATDGQPYEVDREGSAQRSNYKKAEDYSEKLLGVHPRSKWVDDAWLMLARSYIGTDDPLKAVAMLQEFETRFPNSDLRPDAEFFLGLSYRVARKYELAVDRFDNFLAQSPKHELAPYAWYERAQALLALKRPQEAAHSAGQLIERFPRHVLADRALTQRALARFRQRDWKGAREDFRTIGTRATTDDVRFQYLLREVDCLESDRQYDEARAVLRDARSHVPPPPPVPPEQRVPVGPAAAGVQLQPLPTAAAGTVGVGAYGRLTLRMGGVELLAGNLKEALKHYEAVLQDYPRTVLAAEAQYQVGYAYETGADDFTKARAEYEKVKAIAGNSEMSQRAQQRMDNLARIERFRTASSADSSERKAEARFLTAEHFLYNQDRPERALAEYRAIADSTQSPAVVARALNAQAWVLSRKLKQTDAADSLFWKVVREYPATEAQLAARDYLEAGGQVVPSALIRAPKEPERALLDLGDSLKKPPAGTPRLGGPPGTADPTRLGPAGRGAAFIDSMRRVRAARDSMLARAMRDTSAAGRARMDSIRTAFTRPDTTGRAALMADIERQIPRPDSVVLAPADSPPPRFVADSSTAHVTPPPQPGADTARVEMPPAPVTPDPALPEVRGVDQPPPPPARPGADTSRAGRARAAALDALAGIGSGRRLPPLHPMRTDSAGVRHALVPDSLRKLGGSADSTTGPSGTAATTPRTSTPPPPPKPVSRAITSFEKKDRATKLREREERIRAKAVRDSVRQAKKSADAAAKEAARAAKARAKAPPVAPALPDTAATARARRDSLARLVPRPDSAAGIPRPDSAGSARPDTTGGRPR